MPGDVDLALQIGENLVEQAGQVAFVLDAVEEDHELVAAEAADGDAVPGNRRQSFGHGIDQPVADRVAQRVVDALEIVEVEHGQAAETVAVAGGHRFPDQFVEIGAVRQAGEVVVARHEADLFFGFDAGRDILEGDDAQVLAAFACRKLVVLAVGEGNQHLAVAALRVARASAAPRHSGSPSAPACRRQRRAGAANGSIARAAGSAI